MATLKGAFAGTLPTFVIFMTILYVELSSVVLTARPLLAHARSGRRPADVAEGGGVGVGLGVGVGPAVGIAVDVDVSVGVGAAVGVATTVDVGVGDGDGVEIAGAAVATTGVADGDCGPAVDGVAEGAAAGPQATIEDTTHTLATTNRRPETTCKPLE